MTALFLLLEFVPGGDLFYLLRRTKRFPDRVAEFYAVEVTLALAWALLRNGGGDDRGRDAEETELDEDGTVTQDQPPAPIAADDTVTNWVRRADDAMYAAKHGGRNAVCVAPPAAQISG